MSNKDRKPGDYTILGDGDYESLRRIAKRLMDSPLNYDQRRAQGEMISMILDCSEPISEKELLDKGVL